MANIRKSFNFRNGVQVDNDNFVVNANGLVGIGTSVPQTYLLNVYGDTRTTGLTTTRDLYVTQNVEVIGVTTVGVLTASSIDVANGVNVGGALTALTLKLANGDTVDNLIGFARTTFITDNGGVGLHTTSKIGINTTTSPGASNPELSVFGNANVTGIITATTFDGDLTGNVNASSGVSTFTELKVGTAITMSAGIVTATTFVGDVTGTATTATNLASGANITTGTISDARLPNLITSNINASSGVSTVNELKVGTAITMSAGIVIATTFDGNVNASSGVSTFTELKVGTAITMSAGIVTATTFIGALDSTNLTGTINNDRLPVTPQFTSVGIGTTIPANTFQQRATGATELQITSDTASASITVGREPGTSNTNNAEFRYGGGSGFALSNAQSLDIVNYGTGNFNYYLSANNAGAAAGDYVWHKGANNSQLMSLTKDGNLGIGITNPSQKLSVQGISTFTGNAHFESNVTVDGSINISAITATLTGDVQDGSSDVILDVSQKLLNGNVNTVSGISTFNNSKFNKIGISVSPDTNHVLTACSSESNRFHVTGDGKVGIRTTSVNTNMELDVNGDVQARHGLVVGLTTEPKCAVDMSSVVDIIADGTARAVIAYMIPPRVTTTQRNALRNVDGTTALSTNEAGATIYNTTTNKLQVWNGSTWNDCF